MTTRRSSGHYSQLDQQYQPNNHYGKSSGSNFNRTGSPVYSNPSYAQQQSNHPLYPTSNQSGSPISDISREFSNMGFPNSPVLKRSNSNVHQQTTSTSPFNRTNSNVSNVSSSQSPSDINSDINTSMGTNDKDKDINEKMSDVSDISQTNELISKENKRLSEQIDKQTVESNRLFGLMGNLATQVENEIVALRNENSNLKRDNQSLIQEVEHLKGLISQLSQRTAPTQDTLPPSSFSQPVQKPKEKPEEKPKKKDFEEEYIARKVKRAKKGNEKAIEWCKTNGFSF